MIKIGRMKGMWFLNGAVSSIYTTVYYRVLVVQHCVTPPAPINLKIKEKIVGCNGWQVND